MDFKEKIITALKKTGTKNAKELIEIPPHREMGDFALPCFKLAKEQKKKPFEIAEEIMKKIILPKEFEKIEVKGPYLNFFIKDEIYAQNTIEEILEKKENYGLNKPEGKPIIVEYCQANPMKSFHIGHVRNICLGESIAKLLEANKTKVIRMNYAGDVGPHVSKTIYAYQNLVKEKEPIEIIAKGKWIGELYATGAKKVKENPELEEKMREMVVELEKGNPAIKKDWIKLRQISLDYFDYIYKELNIKFDKIILESQVEKKGIAIAEKLEKEGIAIKDEGALLIDLTKYNLDKFLILKSDGAALYSSKDLGLAKMKKQELKAEKTYNVVGSEQKFYFQQLIKTIDLLNQKKKEYCETVHISYELVRLEGGKMASREGKVITFSELLEKIHKKTFNETKKRHENWSPEKIENNSKELALTALKFGMLCQDKNKSIIFNWEKATTLEGETGPFVQYALARANSILKKAGKRIKITNFKPEHKKENELISILANYKKKVEEANATLSPHKIAYYLIELAAEFNSFYHEVPVLKTNENTQARRLALVEAITQVLKNGLTLLNITPIEEM